METIGEVSSMPMWGCLVRETSRAPVTGRQGCLPWRSCRSGSPRGEIDEEEFQRRRALLSP
jgi:hypothetical protein